MILKGIFLISMIMCGMSLDKAPLIFNSNHKFKILQMTDLHFGKTYPSDKQNMNIMKKLISHAKPDFVILTGDSVAGFCHWSWDVPDFFSKWCWSHIPQTMKEMNTNYAIAIGNHDCENGGETKRINLMNYDKDFPFSYSKLSEPSLSGGSTYYLPVFSSFNSSNPALIIWVFDTKQKGCMNMTVGDGCVGKDQINWFLEADGHLRKLYGDYYISLAFAHIPPPEYITLYNEGEVYGNRKEQVCCPKANSGWIDAMISRKVKALFVGHDHNNDFGGVYKGIELVYGRKTGYSAYGPSFGDKGGRTIEVDEINNGQESKVSFKHYVVEETGKIVENGPAYRRTDKMHGC